MMAKTIKFNDSILASVKSLMPKTGIPGDYTVFDDELIGDINGQLAMLSQLGIGKTNEVFSISGTDETWGDFLDHEELLSLVPMYVALRVKLLFDTPSSSLVIDVIKEEAKEYSFRIQDAARRYRKEEQQ